MIMIKAHLHQEIDLISIKQISQYRWKLHNLRSWTSRERWRTSWTRQQKMVRTLALYHSWTENEISSLATTR